jgi:arsenite methyltransferase
MESKEIRETVRAAYASIAGQRQSCGCTQKLLLSDPEFIRSAGTVSGYSETELASIPEGANLGLGCGNPVALATIRKGDVVLDLGSGAGVDCFLASALVGEEGRIIGVDMTPEMVDRAKENARGNGYLNVEFRLGEIENLPVEDESVDVAVSNCVINLSTDKRRVFEEAGRVLKPGGTLLVSDIVLHEELPDYLQGSIEAYIRCIAGAVRRDAYLDAMREAGFEEITVVGESCFPAGLIAGQPRVMELAASMGIPKMEIERIAATVISLKVMAKKGAGMRS